MPFAPHCESPTPWPEPFPLNSKRPLSLETLYMELLSDEYPRSLLKSSPESLTLPPSSSFTMRDFILPEGVFDSGYMPSGSVSE